MQSYHFSANPPRDSGDLTLSFCHLIAPVQPHCRLFFWYYYGNHNYLKIIDITFFNINAKANVENKVNAIMASHQSGIYVYALPNTTLTTAPCTRYISYEWLPRKRDKPHIGKLYPHDKMYINVPTKALSNTIPHGNPATSHLLVPKAKMPTTRKRVHANKRKWPANSFLMRPSNKATDSPIFRETTDWNHQLRKPRAFKHTTYPKVNTHIHTSKRVILCLVQSVMT